MWNLFAKKFTWGEINFWSLWHGHWRNNYKFFFHLQQNYVLVGKLCYYFFSCNLVSKEQQRHYKWPHKIIKKITAKRPLKSLATFYFKLCSNMLSMFDPLSRFLKIEQPRQWSVQRLSELKTSTRTLARKWIAQRLSECLSELRQAEEYCEHFYGYLYSYINHRWCFTWMLILAS